MVCAFCGRAIETVRYKTHKRKAYHYECYDRLLAGEAAPNRSAHIQTDCQTESKELEEYIKKLFRLSELTYTLQEQIVSYTQVQHIKPSTIQKILHYFYEVQGNPVNPERPSIGIVPHVYEEARTYYKKLYELEQQEQEKGIDDHAVTVRINPPDNQLKMKTDIAKL